MTAMGTVVIETAYAHGVVITVQRYMGLIVLLPLMAMGLEAARMLDNPSL